MLHLLYHRDEMVAARQALHASYPDVMGLRHCYAHIRSVLNSRPYATKQDLLGSTREGYRITERVLKLFFDLHFFLEKDGTIVPRQVQPIDMAENPAYQEFCAERDRKEKRLTAVHESGHALIAYLLPDADPVHKVTIIPRGRAGGYTMMLPEEDRSYETKSYYLAQIRVALGGRAAEEIVFNEISSGASGDSRALPALPAR